MATVRDLKTGIEYTSGQWAEVVELKDCDVCSINIQKAQYDARTASGRWAWLCLTHMRTMTSGQLGLGFGQRIFRAGEFEVLP